MIDVNKPYKRIFVFGCSFAQWRYPTWADVLVKSLNPDIEYYNFALAGGGNTFISTRLSQANRKFKFNKDDLVAVMWSTFCREDHWAHSRWITPGNIFTQNEIDDKFVKKFSEPVGYMMRDLTIIETTTKLIDTLPCDTLNILSVPFDYQMDLSEYKNIGKEVYQLYQDLEDSFPESLFHLQMNGIWGQHIKYYSSWSPDKPGVDYHPTTVDYMNYLLKLGINLTDDSKRYAEDTLNLILKNVTYEKDFQKLFPDLVISDQLW